jgi:hypothetical protein
MGGFGMGRRTAAAWAVALTAMALPGTSVASATSIENGGFETGTLEGWHVHRASEAGNWFAYQGTETPFSGKKPLGEPVQPPPQGNFAAITDEANPESLLLYQDINVGTGEKQRLSLLAYYDSVDPIAVPFPDTLSIDDETLAGQANQQFRIDLVRPEAPLESLDPADVLQTLFQTKPGDPKSMPPTRVSADLSPFAGQTVRLRIANAVHEETFNAGVDAVEISDAAGGQAPGSGKGHPGANRGPNSFSFGRARLNRSNGTAILPVRVSGAGSVTAKAAPIKTYRARPGGAATVMVHVLPTAAARKTLRRRHKLRVKVAVTFAPDGDRAERASIPLALRFEAASHHRR